MSDRIRFFKKCARSYIKKNFIRVFVLNALVLLAFFGGKAVLKTIYIPFGNFPESFLSVSYAFCALMIWLSVCPLTFKAFVIFPESFYDKNNAEFQNCKATDIILRSVRTMTAKLLLYVIAFSSLIVLERFSQGVFSAFKIYGAYDFIHGIRLVLRGIFLLLAFICFLLWLSGFACVPHFLANNYENDISFAIKESCRVMKGHRTEYLLLKLSFLPVFVFSYFTFNIPLVIVLPYLTISENVFVSYVLSHKKIPVIYSFSEEKD